MSVFSYAVPIVIAAILITAAIRKVDIAGEFASGAVDGARTLLSIAPMLLLMLTTLGMLRGSGAVDMLASAAAPLCASAGVPPELLPLALLRPISGSGSTALLSQMLKSYGADSAVGRMACVLAASSETTLYTFTVYTAAAGVKKLTPALISALIADAFAFALSVLTVRLFFG